MVQNNSLPCLEGPKFATVSELTDSQPLPYRIFNTSFNIVLPSKPTYPRWSPSFGFPTTLLDIFIVLYLKALLLSRTTLFYG